MISKVDHRCGSSSMAGSTYCDSSCPCRGPTPDLQITFGPECVDCKGTQSNRVSHLDAAQMSSSLEAIIADTIRWWHGLEKILFSGISICPMMSVIGNGRHPTISGPVNKLDLVGAIRLNLVLVFSMPKLSKGHSSLCTHIHTQTNTHI